MVVTEKNEDSSGWVIEVMKFHSWLFAESKAKKLTFKMAQDD